MRWLHTALPSLDTRLPGLRNEGFLATHELEVIRQGHKLDWNAAAQRARPVLVHQGDALLKALGFTTERVDQVTQLLRAGTNGHRVAVAVLLRQDESPELAAARFTNLSPISYALEVATRENLRWVIISQGSRLRLYPAQPDIGVGRRSRAETFLELHANLLRDDDAAFLWLLFSAPALLPGGTLDALLGESARFAVELAQRLRERVYLSVIPKLAEGLAVARGLRQSTAADLADTYSMAVIVLFRLLFIAYAEDRIEIRFTAYLARRPLPGVRAELARLRVAAEQALGPQAKQVEIEDTQLLRRLIARRCIYGVDINPLAVELARLSLWIHTFVPGLPLSLLDRSLVVGNALVGIGQLSEIEDEARKGDLPLFTLDAVKLIGEAMEPLKRLARLADASAAEIKTARKSVEEAHKAAEAAEALCDIVAANRMTGAPLEVDIPHWETVKATLVNSRQHREAQKTLANLKTFHFPVAFPEVFLRPRQGFDVILGNPPWEEATLEEHAFWGRHWPGLRGVTQREREAVIAKLRRQRPDLVQFYEKEVAETEATRKALVTGPYPGMGTGDPDLYEAFCWRFLNLLASEGGWLGVVLPRSAFNAKGSTDFRQAVLENSNPLDVTMLVNNRQWIFPEVHPQYTIGLVALSRNKADGKSVRLRGPFRSLERLHAEAAAPPAEFPAPEVIGWTDSASLPLLPTEESLEIFTQLRKAPRLDFNDGRSWRVRPHRELDATNDKELLDVKSADKPRGFWPVFKGESLDLWEPDTSSYYAWADPKIVLPELQSTRLRGAGNRKPPFSEFSRDVLRKVDTAPPNFARIAFRDVSRATDCRTMRLALVPPKIFITNQAPYLLWPRGDEHDQAYLLGVLCSLPLDWYARRFVETHMNFFVFNPLPVPRPARDDARWQRVVQLAGRLAAVDDRFAAWAQAVGVPCGPLDALEKQAHLHELDAVVAHLYGLTERQLVHLFETFHEGWDYQDRLEVTPEHFHVWGKQRA